MGVDLNTYREQSLETWDLMAPGWEDLREWLMEETNTVNQWIVDKADPQPGQTILDVGAGTGDLGFMAAERVGPEGRVLSTDFSPEMVEVAKRQGASRGLSNVEYRVLDAEKMDLDDDSVDGAVCRWGYMLMADPAAALKETRRVLRDGGALAFAVWMTPERNPWAAIPGMTLVQRGHMPPPEPGAPGIFAMGEGDRVRQLVTGAGFGDPELEEITFQFEFAHEGEIWDMLTRIAGPLARVIKGLPDDERQATREAIFENLADYRKEDGSYQAPAATWGVLVR
jgi:SAM-dependent methyltransferase